MDRLWMPDPDRLHGNTKQPVAPEAPWSPLKKDALASHVEYWRSRLEGVPTLQLPTDRPRPPVLSRREMATAFNLPAGLSHKVTELGEKLGATPFVTLLAAFKVLLFRHTGQTDFAVGSQPYDAPGVGGRVPATTVVALRTEFTGDMRFEEVLDRVRATVHDASAHTDLPFVKLFEIIDLPCDPSYAPFFQVAFAYRDYAEPAGSHPEPGMEPGAIDNGEGVLDLRLTCWGGKESIRGNIEYNAELFDPETIDRLIGHFNALIEGIVTEPSKRISEYPILTPPERDLLLHTWNATARVYPVEKTLVHLFEEQVARSPGAVAVEYEGTRLSYRHLNDRADQLARYLRCLGIGPEVMVGLYMERSLEMVVGIYGIIKAGGAYVPLDPEYPQDRIAFMVADTQVPVLLTQKHLVSNLPEHSAKVICLDSDWGLIAGESPEKLQGGAGPGNLAYVIYTSGSTGRPKGVMNEHRGIVNRLIWMQEEYQLTPEDRVLQKTPFSFDVSVWEFFWPLQVGASLIIARPGGHGDSSYLVQVIKDHGITTLHFVPSMLRIFLEEHDVRRCTSIKRVMCSGEALASDLQKRFFEKVDAELHNLYGPTEAAVDVTYWQCRADRDCTSVPIGYPVANTRMYILDPGLVPVPIGCTGELHIGGIQVARGYLNRADLTAERFIPDPFSRDPDARLYKTGDLARYLRDGSIEYLGRIDFQVKIRGLRVELGEIEARLAEVDAIQKSVVVVREDRPGDQKLVAYYVRKPGIEVSIPDWRIYLNSKLPGYMVPQFFVELESIPLSPNGKVDRKALPKPDIERNAPEKDFVAPRTDLEHQVIAIWQAVLHQRRIGVHDDFFELGGNSLLATQVVSRVRRIFNVQLPLQLFFENRTVAALAERVDMLLWAARSQHNVGRSQAECSEREVFEI
jgi:amino acid adenylation domain-containing protein